MVRVLRVVVLLTCAVIVYGTTQTLYTGNTPVVQLDVDSFQQTLTRSETAWVVEFYMAWCGHCQRFAPIYKKFAEDIQGWSNVIRVGAVACSDPRNQPVCRQQDVRGYPSIKYYPPNLASMTRGFKLNSLRFSADSVRSATAQFIEDYVTPSNTNPPLKRFTNLGNLKSSVAGRTPRHLLAIVEDPRTGDSERAKLVILDVSSLRPDAVVGRLSRSALPDPSHIWQPLPALVAIGFHDNSVRYVTQVQSREQVVQEIRAMASGPQTPHHISSAHSSILSPGSQGNPHHPASTPTRRPVPNVHSDHRLQTSRQPSRPSPVATPRPQLSPNNADSRTAVPPAASNHGDVSRNLPIGITQDDLDTNLYYTLWIEVPSRTYIRGKALPALKGYLEMLHKYHPGNERTKSFISNVYRWLQRIGGSVRSELYLNTIEGLQSNSSHVVKDINWRSCRGTEEKFRGYPCSLWMTFHALTVSAYKDHLEHPQVPFDPQYVLNTVRMYIKYFFGCRDCAEHFLAMSRRINREVIKPEDGVLWLWKAHNSVNNRLHGDDTEDPSHPKIQFPGVELCPKCRYDNKRVRERYDNDTTWNVNEIVSFLSTFYSSDTLRNHQNTSASQSAAKGLNDKTSAGDRLPANPPAISDTCVSEETPWSTCSETCGVGVSTRFINNNDQCEMRMEMRICRLRRCDARLLISNTISGLSSEQCAYYGANIQEVGSQPLVFNNCTTVSSHRWRYCGVCPGYCCEPVQLETFWMDMTCGGDQSGKARVMWIHKCKCRRC